MSVIRRSLALAFASVVVAGACGSTATTTPSTSGAPGTTAPGSTAPASSAPPGTLKPATGPAEVTVVATPYGQAVGRGDGLVLYAWDKEADGTVACVSEKCLEKWPPLLGTDVKVGAGLDATRFSLITRADGNKQVAMDGHPLYTMSADTPGDANCQGLDGWWILNPDGTKNTKTTPV